MCDGGQKEQQQSTQVTDVPGWARGYAQEVLGKGQALSNTPYQPYRGDRQAQFTPLQQQSFSGAHKLAPNAATMAGAGLAGTAAGQALGTSYSPYQTGQFTGDTAANYMNPYTQNVVGAQLREADRHHGTATTQLHADATRAKAVGGGRHAIMQAEAARNHGMLRDDIVNKGYSQAFDQGRSQFNTEHALGEQSRQYGAGLGLQGLQTAITGAQTMGQLGQQAFNQGADTLKLQNQFGTQQQQQVQNILDQRYADFQAQQRHPYQQLEFMSSLTRGTPTGTVQTMYSPPPSALSQVAGLGMAGAGMYRMANGMAEGGLVALDRGPATYESYEPLRYDRKKKQYEGDQWYVGQGLSDQEHNVYAGPGKPSEAGAGRGKVNPPRSKKKYAEGGLTRDTTGRRNLYSDERSPVYIPLTRQVEARSDALDREEGKMQILPPAPEYTPRRKTLKKAGGGIVDALIAEIK
jgi:hypothetical protein